MDNAQSPVITFPQAIDNSLLSTFKRCPTAAYWESIRKKRIASPNVHLNAGGAFAHGLEVTRDAFYNRDVPSDDAIALGIEALIGYWKDIDGKIRTTKTLDRMVGALIEYFELWKMESDVFRPYRKSDGTHAIEFNFAIPLEDILHPETGEPIIYCGRLDMLVQDSNGLILVEDDKTASQLGDQWIKNWNLDSQFTGYCWAMRQHDIPVAGALIRGISILKDRYGSAQAITYRSQRECEEWLSMTKYYIKSLIAMWQSGFYPKTLDKFSCNSYGGCSYEQLCKTDNPERWLDGYYMDYHWNPLTRTST